MQADTRREQLGLAGFAALTAGAAASASVATRQGLKDGWYARLEKPPFQPPPQAFGPVWTALYGLIATSGWRVWRQPPGRARSRALALWGAQLLLNAGWSWLFFAQRRKRASLVEIAALGGTITAYALTARKVDAPAAWMMVPYLAWTGFAALLDEELVRRNP